MSTTLPKPEISEQHQKRKWIWRTIQSAVSIALLGFLICQIDDLTLRTLAALSPQVIVLSVTIFGSSQMFGSLRLWLLLQLQGRAPSIPQLTILTFIGFFTNNFLPSTIGGDLYKAFALARAGYPIKVVATALIFDRFLSLITILLMTFGAVAFSGLWITLPSVNLGTFSILMIVVPVLGASAYFALTNYLPSLNARLCHSLSEFTSFATLVVRWPVRILAAVVLSVLSTASAIIAQVILARALGMQIGFIEMTAIVGVVMLLALAPVSINGIGIQEVGFVATLHTLGFEKEVCIAFALLSRLLIICVSIPGGLLCAFPGRLRIVQRPD